MVLRGKGIHSGLSSAVQVRRRDDSLGMRFFWPGWTVPLLPKDLGLLHRHARHSTILEGMGGEKIRTPEHLLAAALFFADAPLDVSCDVSEPPGLDGSALPFYNLLEHAAPEAVKPPHWREYPSDLKWEYIGPEGSLRATPSETFSVEYEWDKPSQKQSFILRDAATAVREILPARTFIHYREWLMARDAADLLAGADSESGLLLAESREEFDAARRIHPQFQGSEFPLLHPGAFRGEQEPVRHKILDLLGDLALSGLALPKLWLEVRNGGHALNHLLLDELLQEQRKGATAV